MLNDISILYTLKNKNFSKELEKIFSKVILKESLDDAFDVFFSKKIDCLITDISFDGTNSFNKLELFRKANPDIPIIIISKSYLDIKLAYKLSLLNITGLYIEKDIKNHFLSIIIDAIQIYQKNENNKNFMKILTSVMDSQKDIMFAIDYENITYANKSFFEFFQINSIDAFHKKYISLQNLILKNPLSVVYLDKALTTELFIEHLYSLKEEHRTIALKDDIKGEIKIFLIKISFIKEGFRLFSLVDITDMAKRQYFLEEKANLDNLTQIYNRNKLNELLMELDFHNGSRNYGFIFLDLDLFKRINDTYGHDIGDIVLKEISHLLKKNIRKTDILARWGGEEFVLVFPNNTYEHTLQRAKELNEMISLFDIEKVGRVTVSMGVSHSNFGIDFDSIRILADKALYKAKKNGRNRVEGSH